MARRRDTRIFGPGPYVLGLRREGGWGSGFPFDVPAVAAVEEIKLDRPVTLLAGDNGSGKSTILEAIAEAIGFARARAASSSAWASCRPCPGNVLGRRAGCPVLSATKPRNGYFLRAESFFNVARVHRQRRPVRARPVDLRRTCRCTQQSHGESFLALAANRFGGDGPLPARRARGGAVGPGALALLAVIAPRRRVGRAVRHRHPLADPARLPGRPDLRARRGPASRPPTTTICRPSA